MAQAAFQYTDSHDGPASACVLAPTASVIAAGDRAPGLVAACRDSGFEVSPPRALGSLHGPGCVVLGDTVVVDCSVLSIADYDALLRLDERALRSGARVIAIVSARTLDAAFGLLARAQAQFLVDPRSADIALALALCVPGANASRVRELDETDRLALLRLTEEVGRMAAKLDALAMPLGGDSADGMSDRLASPTSGFRGVPDLEATTPPGEGDALRRARAPLPDPRLVQRIIRQRRLRERYFESELFADPAWDILLDLTAARAEHRRVSVTSLCIAAAVPATTALRWVQQMTEMGLLRREQDPDDRRRAFVALADPVADAMARYFDELGKDAARLV